jgi:carbon-monoxide dehydrogenase iron sulfur subunit
MHMRNKYDIKCGLSGCTGVVIGDCFYCGIPLCEEHSRKIVTPKGEEIYCPTCFAYLSVSGLKDRDLSRRIIPNLLLVNSKKCTGCRTCQMVCSFEHHNVFSYEKAALRLNKDEEYGLTEIVVCRQCKNPQCVEACPTGALQKDEETGFVLLNREECTQCLRCVDACPYDAIFTDKDKTIVKCDLCGGDPMCARYCPVEAIEWVKKYEVGERHRLVWVVPHSNEEA